jgi:hypothetical protein
LEFGRIDPRVSDRFDPVGHWHRSDVPTFAYQVDYGPVFLTLL